MPTVPSTDNCIQWSGNGTVIIQVGDHGSKLDYAGMYIHLCKYVHTHMHTQSSVEYYGCSCCDDNQTFSIDLTTLKKKAEYNTVLDLGIIVRY